MTSPAALTFTVLLFASTMLRAAEAAPLPAAAIREGASLPAADTLDCGTEENADAAACLEGLKWDKAPFSVRFEPAREEGGDWLVRFPTPLPIGDATNDSVAMEWNMARDEAGHPKHAPAAVIVHESGRGMVAGRAIARGLRGMGVHTFLIHLPGYGARTSPYTRDMKNMLHGLRQAVADVRRARDAVAALPLVDKTNIAVQGTSLGGFVVATVSGLDRGYDKSFILLAGGRIADVILNGAHDAAAMKRQLKALGVTDGQIREMTSVIEPTRIAHRVDPRRTWVFSGKFDEVVPPSSTAAFARAAKLDWDHNVILPVGHYSAAILLPVIMPKLGELMLARPEPR